MAKKQIPLSTPGQILKREFLAPLGITEYRLAKSINVDATRINLIIKGKRSITPETALRLSKFFGMSEGFFIRLQADYDLRKAKRDLGEKMLQEVVSLKALQEQDAPPGIL